MRFRLTSIVAMAALMALDAPEALAQCNFNIGAATRQQVSLVRDFAACLSSQHPAYNASAFGANPFVSSTAACSPVLPNDLDLCAVTGLVCETNADCWPTVCSGSSEGCAIDSDCGGAIGSCTASPGNVCTPTGLTTTYVYGPKGTCTASARSKIEADCSQVEDSLGHSLLLPAGACHVTYVKAKCRDIRRADGSLADGAVDEGFSLTARVRMAFDDSTTGDLSLLEFPVTLAYAGPTNGAMSIVVNSAEILAPLVSPVNAALPPCTQFAVLELGIRDPLLRPFATVGMGTPP